LFERFYGLDQYCSEHFEVKPFDTVGLKGFNTVH